MLFTFILGIDEDVIKVHYYENIKLFYQDLIDVTLERDQYINQSKRYHLVLKIVITTFKCRFSFIAFFDFYLIVGIG